MASEKTKTAIIISVVALFALGFIGGITWLVLKMKASAAERKALAELKENNPVEYYILHTPPAKNVESLKSSMVGTWEMAALLNRRTGQFIFLPSRSGAFKTWTETNWSIVTYDGASNVLYTAGGHYTLEGENYTESIEAATGQMTQYRGQRPRFRVRVVGDNYYQMGTGSKNASPLEEMWRRVE